MPAASCGTWMRDVRHQLLRLRTRLPLHPIAEWHDVLFPYACMPVSCRWPGHAASVVAEAVMQNFQG